MSDPNQSYTVGALRRTAWDVYWNGNSLGLLNDVSPNLKLVLDKVVTGTTGKVTLDMRFCGVEGTIKVQTREVNIAKLDNLCPWGANGSLSIGPTVLNAGLYQYAEPLILHPHDKALSDLTEDVCLIKAVPITPCTNITRKGTEDDIFETEFMPFPDQAALLAPGTTAALQYGGVGGAQQSV